MLLTLDVVNQLALGELELALQPGEEGHGEVQVRLKLGESEHCLMRLGHDFRLDGKLAEQLQAIEGIANVNLIPKTGPQGRRFSRAA